MSQRTNRHRCVLLGDSGQATLLALVVLAVAVGAVALLAQLGGLAADRSRARTAADAAALAGVIEGQPGAADVASRNNGELEGFARVGEDTEVTVRVGRARATSRARLLRLVSGGAGAIPYTRDDVHFRVAARPTRGIE